jgi:hypothetical protein
MLFIFSRGNFFIFLLCCTKVSLKKLCCDLKILRCWVA